MSQPKSSRYAESGVDIDKANEFIDNIKPLVSATFQRGVLTDIGGFGGAPRDRRNGWGSRDRA